MNYIQPTQTLQNIWKENKYLCINKPNDITYYPNKLVENNFQLHGQENHDR